MLTRSAYLGSFASIASVVTVTLMLSFAGCKQDMKFIDHVVFKPSENLETVRISLVFTNKIKSDLAGGFALKDYGYLFVNPFTSNQAFEVGFDLNTSIVNEQDYIELTPTEVLPNGIPIGLPNAVVEIRSPNPIHAQFDIFGYVDVLHANWLGAAAIFTFLDNKNFPPNLSVSQVFLRDEQGRPGVMGSVFGPTLNDDGTLARAGGIAVFANVRQLLNQHKNGGTFHPEPAMILSGSAASQYEGQYEKLGKVERQLIRGFNSQRK